jgi:hypothetical protein
MNTSELVEWQIYSPNGLIYPWWTHNFLSELEGWELTDVNWLEFGAGRGTQWLRSKCKWVDSIEANQEWASQAFLDCFQNDLGNGRIKSETIADGVVGGWDKYKALIPTDKQYDIISIDGIYRTECIEWGIEHFKGRNGVLVLDNLDQDFVWISPKAMELIAPFEEKVFIQENHTNNAGKKWNTRFVVIPK